MRTSKRPLNESLKSQITKTFAAALLEFKDLDESFAFLSDFLTKSELETYSKRFAIAYWLKKKRSYANISTNLKVSSATIAEVSQMMKKKGFARAIKRLEAEEWANQWEQKIKRFLK